MTEAQSTPVAVEGALDRLNRDRGKPARPRPAEQLSAPTPAALSIVPSQAVRDGPDRMASSAATAERQLLGGLILEGAAATVMAISALVEVGDFYQPRHQALFSTLLSMAREGESLTLVDVVRRVQGTQKLAEKVGGLSYISALGDDVVSTVGLDRRAQEVRVAAIRRSARLTGQRVKEWLEHAAHDESVDLSTVLARAIREVTVLEAALGRVGIASGPDPEVWAKLSMTDRKEPRSGLSNLSIIFGEDTRWKTLRLNQIGELLELDEDTWDQGPAMRAKACRWLAQHYSLEANHKLVEEALLAVAQERAYNPVQEYLRGLVWDGEPRIHRLLKETLGIDEMPLYQEYIRKYLIGAVARALEPGCKMDTALILVGDQGGKKSSFFEVLFSSPWFGDSPIPIGDKDAAIQLSCTWGYEAAEMEDITRRTAEAVKQFITTKADVYRSPYERSASRKPRHSVLCGSCNKPEILSDETGDRRFWPLTVPDPWTIPLHIVREWRDQLWAEARVAYEAKERWWFERGEAEAMGRKEDMQAYQIHDPWEPEIERHTTSRWSAFTTEEIMDDMKLDRKERDQRNAGRICRVLRMLGYVSKSVRFPGGRVTRRWVHERFTRTDESEP